LFTSGKIIRIGDILTQKVPDGKRVTVAGMVSQLRVRQLKNNHLLATGQIEEPSGAVNITVFANAYGEFKSVLTAGKPVFLSGRVSEREDREPEIVCERVEWIPDSAKGTLPKKKSTRGLYLQIDRPDSELFEKVKTVLRAHSGGERVFLYCTETRKLLEAPASLRVGREESLIDELSAVLGAERVKTVR
ncbi:MAG: hypothetical protein IJT66_04660, partial [Clostridia bacterium]|nr:hypothetical protein [Clostridia bacterium]